MEKAFVKNTFIFDTFIKTDQYATCVETRWILKDKIKAAKSVVFDKTKYTKDSFVNDLKMAPWFLLYQQIDVSSMFEKFEEIVHLILEKHAPMRTIFRKKHKSHHESLEEKCRNEITTLSKEKKLGHNEYKSDKNPTS